MVNRRNSQLELGCPIAGDSPLTTHNSLLFIPVFHQGPSRQSVGQSLPVGLNGCPENRESERCPGQESSEPAPQRFQKGQSPSLWRKSGGQTRHGHAERLSEQNEGHDRREERKVQGEGRGPPEGVPLGGSPGRPRGKKQGGGRRAENGGRVGRAGGRARGKRCGSPREWPVAAARGRQCESVRGFHPQGKIDEGAICRRR
jgi:hypothetical protein